MTSYLNEGPLLMSSISRLYQIEQSDLPLDLALLWQEAHFELQSNQVKV
jgi:hypothetical protein